MAIIVPDEGEVILLNKALQTGENGTLKLYTAVSPSLSESTTGANFTEATFTGYAAKTLTSASWGGASTAAGVTSSTYAAQTWTNSGSAQTILGYYVVGATSGKVLWCEAFSSSQVINAGGTLTVTPVVQLD